MIEKTAISHDIILVRSNHILNQITNIKANKLYFFI